MSRTIGRGSGSNSRYPNVFPMKKLDVKMGLPPILVQAMRNYFNERGMDWDQVSEQARLFGCTADTVERQMKRRYPQGLVGAIVFPFLNLDGSPILDRGSPFGSLRLMGVDDSGKAPQLPGTGVHAYIPPHHEWPYIAMDPTQPIIIVEGEAKAMCGMYKLEIPTIGIRGVFNFQLPTGGLLPELRNIVWQERTVYICFDSDIVEKIGVQQAMTRIVATFTGEHAIVKVIDLAALKIEGGKGLDDCVVRGATWEQIEATAKAPNDFEHLDKNELFLLNTLAYHRKTDKVVDLTDGSVHTVDGMKNRWAKLKSPGLKAPVFTFQSRWLPSKMRKEVVTDVFDPARPPGYLPLIDGGGELNHWPGLKLVPADDELYKIMRPYLREWESFVRMLMSTDDEGEMPAEYFMKWIAHAIQKPWEKTNCMILLVSSEGGIGKTYVFDTCGKLFEPMFMSVPPDRFANPKQKFVIAGAEKCYVFSLEELDQMFKTNTSLFKAEVTGNTMVIEPKNIPAFVMPNYRRFMATSNQLAPIMIADNERRVFVIRCRSGLTRASKLEFKTVGGEYQDLAVEKYLSKREPIFRGEDFLRALLRHYMEMDLSDFDAKVAPPVTEGLKDMVRASGGASRTIVEGIMHTLGPRWAIPSGALQEVIVNKKITVKGFYNTLNDMHITILERNSKKTGKVRTFGIDRSEPVTDDLIEESLKRLMRSRF